MPEDMGENARDSTDCASQVSIIALSDAGKPIFAFHNKNDDSIGNDETLTSTCGLLQALLTSIRYSALEEEICCLESDSMIMVFMTVGAITLVAISTVPTNTGEPFDTESYLRLQLEYVYMLIVFHFTDRIQTMFQQNASFDLHSLLVGNGDAMLRSVLTRGLSWGDGSDFAETSFSPAPFLTAGVPIFGPIPHSIRERASVVLQQVGDDTVQMFASLLIVGGKMLTMVQSPYLPHQLKSSDVYMVLHFVCRQQLASGELWVPLCLPRFNSTGFMHCYINCLDVGSKLTVVFMSQDSSTDQFQRFRTAASRIRRCLGVPAVERDILEILAGGTAATDCLTAGGRATNDNDISWRRSAPSSSEIGLEDDYEMIPYFDEATGVPIEGPWSHTGFFPELVASVASSGNESPFADLLDDGLSTVLHFCFRVDVPIVPVEQKQSFGIRIQRNDNRRPKQHGRLIQCLAPALTHFDNAAKRQTLKVFQRLHLRLRLGSASFNPLHDAYRTVEEQTRGGNTNTTHVPTCENSCPSLCLSECAPKIEGFAYLSQGNLTYLGMNGHGFEL